MLQAQWQGSWVAPFTVGFGWCFSDPFLGPILPDGEWASMTNPDKAFVTCHVVAASLAMVRGEDHRHGT